MKTRRKQRARACVTPLDPRLLLTSTTFTLSATLPQPTNVVAVATADLNHDAHPDLVAIDGDQGRGQNSTVYVFLNNGDGTFASPLAFTTGLDAESLLIADVNGDGTPDVLTANVSSSDVSVLLGNGDGTFRSRLNVSVAADPRAIAIADFNGDHVMDLAIAEEGNGDTGGQVDVLLGNDDGTFLDFDDPVSLTGTPETLVAGDFDADGTVDLAASVLSFDQVSSSVDVLLNDGGSTFTRHDGPTLFGVPNSGVVADLNRDNIPDLGFATSSGVELLFGLADGTFTDDSLITDGGAVAGLAAADLNADGRLDLVSGSQTGPMVGLSGSTDQFLKEQLVGSSTVSLSFAIADFNGDGALDFAAASDIAHALQVFTSATTNDPPTPPAIGGLDPGFGNGSGKVVNTVPTANLTSVDTAIVQQGELLSAGLDVAGNQVILNRYYTDGTPDNGFGGARGVRTAIPDGFTAARVAFDQGTNTVVIFGTLTATNQPALIRLAPGGYIDESVGNDGILAISAFHPGDEVDSITTVKTGYVIGGRALESNAFSAVLLELTTAGGLSPKFGTKGLFIVPATHGPVDAIESLVADAKGEIFATGTVSAGTVEDGSLTSSILTFKLSSAGKLDKSFGEKTFSVPGFSLAAGQKILIQEDGKIVVSGDFAANETAAAQGLFGSVLVRYTSKGVLDTSFDNTGYFVVTSPATNTATSSLLTAGIHTADSRTSSYGDLLSNRTAAASAITGGKLRQEAAMASSGNTVLTLSQVVADAADLKLSALTLSGKSPYKATKKATATLSLSDAGTLPLTTITLPISLYLSADDALDTTTDPTIPTPDLKLSLKPGQSKKSAISFTMPAAYGGGPFHLFVVADADGSAITELTLGDNTARTNTTFAISGAATLASATLEQVLRPRHTLFSRTPVLWGAARRTIPPRICNALAFLRVLTPRPPRLRGEQVRQQAAGRARHRLHLTLSPSPTSPSGSA